MATPEAPHKLAEILARDPALESLAARPIRDLFAELIARATRAEAAARLPDGHSFLRAALQIQRDLEHLDFTNAQAAAPRPPVPAQAPAAAPAERPSAAAQPAVVRTKTKPGVGSRPEHAAQKPAPPAAPVKAARPRWLPAVLIALALALALFAFVSR